LPNSDQAVTECRTEKVCAAHGYMLVKMKKSEAGPVPRLLRLAASRVEEDYPVEAIVLRELATRFEVDPKDEV